VSAAAPIPGMGSTNRAMPLGAKAVLGRNVNAAVAAAILLLLWNVCLT